MGNILLLVLWTLCLYLLHRLVHVTPILNDIHRKHHVYILNNDTGWHWNNLLLYNDNLECTIDLWITDVIPTIVFCFIFDAWWIFALYWVWAAFLQEGLEHNRNVNYSGLTMGRWHLLHHTNPRYNFGLFLPIWDKIFRTEKCVR